MGHRRKPTDVNRAAARRAKHGMGAAGHVSPPQKGRDKNTSGQNASVKNASARTATARQTKSPDDAPQNTSRQNSSKHPKRARTTSIAKTALGVEPAKRRFKRSDRVEDPASAQNPQREASVRVKTAKGRKLSSTLWLRRQLNDPYVARARAAGYRSRAAYKLLEIDEKAALLQRGDKVVDLGAAPGGWCQVAARKTGADAGHRTAQVIGIDYLGMPPVDGAEVLELDFLDHKAPARLKQMLAGTANIVLSDMAAPSTGHRATDHLRIIALAEAAFDFAEEVLAPQGHFVAKVFQGGAQNQLLARLKARFETVTHIKPKASRAQSPETYVVARRFRG